jgi:hypothetical protein
MIIASVNNTSTTVPMIDCIVNRVTVRTLVDTGASHSLIDAKFMSEMVPTPELKAVRDGFALTAANGLKLMVKGWISVEVQASDGTVTTAPTSLFLLVVDSLHGHMLLGANNMGKLIKNINVSEMKVELLQAATVKR